MRTNSISVSTVSVIFLFLITLSLTQLVGCGRDNSAFVPREIHAQVVHEAEQNQERAEQNQEEANQYKTLFYIMILVVLLVGAIALIVGASMGSKAKSDAKMIGDDSGRT